MISHWTRAQAVLQAFSNYISERVRLRWRQALVVRLHQAYFVKRIVYATNVLDSRIDNLDQRITQDVEDLTYTVLCVMTSPSICVPRPELTTPRAATSVSARSMCLPA